VVGTTRDDTGFAKVYENDRWHTSDFSFDGELQAVWGSDPQDVYVVGSAGVVYRYDGESWSEHGHLEFPNDHGAVYAASIWGRGRNDIFLLMLEGASVPGLALFHWDGSRWTRGDSDIHFVSSGVYSSPLSVFVTGDRQGGLYAADSNGRVFYNPGEVVHGYR
jgi:hypothetical protein